MNITVKISVRQFTVVVMFYTIGTSILVIPAGLAADAGQDAWITTMLGWLIGLGCVGLYMMLGKQFTNMTLYEYNEKVFGKWAGKIIFSFFYIHFVCWCCNCFILCGELYDHTSYA